jgi:hypothetical protein
MNYTISRNGQEFGPYSLADLQHYISTGDVLLTDMARSEGMTDYMPVSQIVGTIAVPVRATTISAPAVEYPDPPDLHWALVLVFSMFSCGLFSAAWALVQASWMRKVDPKSKALTFYGIYVGLLALLIILTVISTGLRSNGDSNVALAGLVSLLRLGSIVIDLVARYSLRSSLEEHFNTAEPMGLRLSGVMTFFFSITYFQYHLNDINKRKQMDRAMLVGR